MTITTVQGDMWDEVSERVYGSTQYTDALIAANPAHIRTYIFPSGVALDCPAVEEAMPPNSLPPWKKVSG